MVRRCMLSHCKNHEAINKLAGMRSNDKMSIVHNYVVCGGRKSNPASLSVHMQPVKLTQNTGMAVTSIGHGEIYNINSFNNKYMLKVKSSERVDESGRPLPRLRGTFKLPKGHYNDAEQVLVAISSQIDEYAAKWNISSRCHLVKENGKLILSAPPDLEFLGPITSSPFELIEADVQENVVIARDSEIPDSTVMCFMYVSIIEQSYINGKKSRILSVLPLNSCRGYSFFQNQVPTYVPVEVREFADISISLRNIRGELIEMDNSQDTIISLHLKSLRESGTI